MVVSIVSHGHGQTVLNLLRQIARQGESCVARVILTLNVPEPELMPALQDWRRQAPGLPLTVVANPAPQGFGRNHNRALGDAQEPFFCILNPDIRLLQEDSIALLLQTLRQPQAGLAYPVLLGSDGRWQDNERSLTTPWSLFLRRALGREERRVDWVSGACMLVSARTWRALGGFDERFHMYCEDVDFSLRVRRLGLALCRAPVRMEHQARRDSRKRWRYLAWHLHSMMRLWLLPSFWWGVRNPATTMRQQPAGE